MSLTRTEIEEVIHSVKYNYCDHNWSAVVDYYGEENADKLDFLDRFDYEAVYAKGNVKECTAFCNLSIIQKFLVGSLFDVAKNEEALVTWITIDYWTKKLFDKGTGVNTHTWLH